MPSNFGPRPKSSETDVLVESRSEAVAWIDGFIGEGIRPGLDRIRRLLSLLGNPERNYPIIHVAGTNGKTSTSRLAAAIVAGHGLRSGLFTSPHLERIEERFQLDLEVPEERDFIDAVNDIVPFVEALKAEGGSPTYFEVTAAIAFERFSNQSVDVGVVEVGLGGRLDATNAADGAVAVVTSIGLEHQEYLGNTIGDIATEKLGIVKPGALLVTGALPDEAEVHAARLSAEFEVERIRLGVDLVVEDPRVAVGGWLVDIAGRYDVYRDLHLPVHGRHQVDNLALAIGAVEGAFGRALSQEALQECLAVFTNPGRMEVLRRHPLLMIDGAHNPHGMDALAGALDEEFGSTEWVAVVGSMRDKDLSMFEMLEPHVEHYVCTAHPSARAIPADDLAAGLRSSVNVPVHVEAEPMAAIARARDLVGDDGGVVVAGSLYLVGDIRRELGTLA